MALNTGTNPLVMKYKQFLSSRETGLTQGSVDWVNARVKSIGGSEMAALMGALPFETPASLLAKKLQPRKHVYIKRRLKLGDFIRTSCARVL